MAKNNNAPFHHGSAAIASSHVALLKKRTTVVDRDLGYLFFPHFHPYVRELIGELIERSVAGLQAADTRYLRTSTGVVVKLPDGRPHPVLHENLFTGTSYDPGPIVAKPYPVKDIDFSSTGAYAIYNWELFYHVPITVAIHLSRNGRFEDAQRWFHYVFDPTDASADPSPQRFWKVRQFHQIEVRQVEEVLVNLSTQEDKELLAQTLASIHAWKDAPFRPHLVAGYRQWAYMIKAVTAYLDNLVDWGDALFRQDTGESINEATQLYVLAANILGPRPQEVPRKGWQRPQSYESLRAELDALGNVMTEVEVDIPFDLLPQPTDASDQAALATVASIGTALYFCVPRNDKLLRYWDTVADRLFKIRNSLNIQGVFRQLPLFEPPIDPALLAKATAAGLDVSAVLAGLNQPLPLVRFGLLVQKAGELCQIVTSLGNQLLSAIEKEDAEALGLLRAQHETALLRLGEHVRYQQWQETIKAREAVQMSFASAVARYTFYELQLGRPASEISVPELEALDADALAKMKLNATEPELTPRDITVDIASDLDGADGKHISSYEDTELDLLWWAQLSQDAAAVLDATGSFLAIIPDVEASAKPVGVGAGVRWGGTNLHHLFSGLATVARGVGGRFAHEASMAAKVGSYARRELEWTYQSNVALGEITQAYKQWRAAQIREATAEREWRNHQEQIRHAEQIEAFLAGEKTAGMRKTSTIGLYAWLRREVRALHGQAFQLAFDTARRAERALQHELGDATQSFLQFGYTAGKEGLLAGEKLQLDIKRMELAYHELNRREYELTKHVSLRQLDPVALVRLRATGSCEITLPEELFDLDCPGHYFRRLRSVAVSVPCVVGPYTSVNCTLTMMRSTIRTSAQLLDGEYARDGEDTERFSDHYGRIESIVTSTGSNDGGVFEGGRDDRVLPFENAGAISGWRLSLPAAVRKFDLDTISDVILHLRYTAREGGEPLKAAAEAHLAAQIAEAVTVGSVRLLSLRRDFPSEWAKFTASPPNGISSLRVELREEHYPLWATASTMELRRVELFAKAGAKNTIIVYEDAAGTQQKLTIAPDGAPAGLLYGKVPANQELPPATGAVTWHLDDNTMTDLWLALTWGQS